MKQKQLVSYGIIGIFVYLIAAGLSFAGFSYFSPKTIASNAPPPTKTAQQHFKIDPSVPRTEPCPINGVLRTKQEREIWEKRRPLAVMIENHEEARPQSGLSSADVVYESVAEGGITRFMGVFYCDSVGSITVAPVRSARVYFLPWVLEYDALYNHVGGAGNCNDDTVDERAKALCRIDEWKIKDMDQFGISFPTCYRNYDRLDHPVATEHTMVCFTDKLYKIAEQRGWTNVDTKGVSWDKNFKPWSFKDEAKTADRGAVSSFNFTAWKGYDAYSVRWDYDPVTNTYKRFNGGKPHLDLETKEQLAAKNVVVLFAKETGPVDDHMHLLYNNIGSGDAIVYQDGKTIKGRWTKADKSARTKFTDTAGTEIQFNRGQIWIEMLPIGTPIN